MGHICAGAAPAVLAQQQRRGVPHVGVLARQDGRGQHALHAAAAHHAPVAGHAARQRARRAQRPLVAVGGLLPGRLQGLARDLGGRRRWSRATWLAPGALRAGGAGRRACRVARLGRSQLRENSTACQSSRMRFRDEPTRPITCAPRARPGCAARKGAGRQGTGGGARRGARVPGRPP